MGILVNIFINYLARDAVWVGRMWGRHSEKLILSQISGLKALGWDGKEQIAQATVCCTNSTCLQAGEKEGTLKRLILSQWTQEGG